MDMEMLPLPLNIFKNNMATYQEVQVCQVRGIDLVEVMNNMVDVSDNYGVGSCPPPKCTCVKPEHRYGFCEDFFLPGLLGGHGEAALSLEHFHEQHG